MKFQYYYFFLFTFFFGCKNTQNDKFTIELVGSYTDTMILHLSIDFRSIDSVEWETQTYYFNNKTIKKLNMHAFGSSSEQFMLKFNGKEIYRASAVSIYNSNPYPKNLAFFKVYSKQSEPFNSNAIQFFDLEKAIINKELFEKTKLFLTKKGLIK